ncbi:trehalose-phosphatase [Halobaculum lipolyticum]|uniref:Trehalose 6-phosphate phosphatase n=1 Tax=Halobaculum lipolyticum TaxID=3032001 RepID=A0ABD5WE35_9EURY|nr:trehalose-phosphatase [Halobaculum sp. DT31]
MTDAEERAAAATDGEDTVSTEPGGDADPADASVPTLAPVADVLTDAADLGALVHGSAGVVVGLDFDGTLAPVVDDHAGASLAPAVRPVLRRLAARPSVLVAVVSGRALDDLRGRVGRTDEGVVYAGNHGLELGHGDETVVHPDALRRRDDVAGLCDALGDRLADVPGTAVENKGITATVHYRTAHSTAVPGVIDAVETAVADRDGLRVTAGDRIREIRPAVDWDKGDAMRLLSAVAPDDWTTVYVGDDVTDEDAFAAVQPDGAGVHVARGGSAVDPGETAAAHRLDGQSSVTALLRWIDEVAPRPSRRVDWSDLRPLDDPFGPAGR